MNEARGLFFILHQNPKGLHLLVLENNLIHNLFFGMKKRILLFGGLFWAVLGQAQQNFKTQSVSIFKNNTAFFIKSGEVRPNAEKAWLWQSDSLPQALAGTFWLGSPSADLSSVRSMLEDKVEQKMVGSYQDMLDANDGKRVKLHLAGDSLPLEGKIQIIKFQKEKSEQLYALLANDKTIILSAGQLSSLKRVEFLDTPNFTKEHKRKSPTIRADFKSAKANQPVDLMYLEKGLIWQPEYLVELLSDTKAKISMRAVITNEAEDVETQEMNLVAGVPNFKYATQITDFLKFLYPTATQAAELAYLRQAAPQTFSNSFRNDSRMYDAPMMEADIAPDPSPDPSPIIGESVEDLYYYPLKNIVLKKGERGIFDIFNNEVSVEHIYETNLGGNQATYSKNYVLEKSISKVEHNLEILNTSPYVWSSGTIMVVQNNNGKISPISQDRLDYTSMKKKEKVFLTEAPDVAVTRSEKEISRQVDEKKFTRDRYTYYYDLITVEGEVDIRNYKNKDINLETKYAIVGEPVESSVAWEQAKRPVQVQDMNGSTNVCWKQKIKAGEQTKIKYKYKMYVLRYNEYK